MSAPGGAESTVSKRSRAVVLYPRTGSEPSALLKTLSTKGTEVVVVSSDLWAMAHACLHGAGSLVVISEPAKVGIAAAQLVLALRKYIAGVVVYCFEPADGQLRPVVEQDLVDWGAPGKPGESASARPSPPRSIGKPMLRLTGDDEPHPIGPSLPITEHNASASDVLSADELAMLLGRNRNVNNGGPGNAKGDQR